MLPFNSWQVLKLDSLEGDFELTHENKELKTMDIWIRLSLTKSTVVLNDYHIMVL